VAAAKRIGGPEVYVGVAVLKVRRSKLKAAQVHRRPFVLYSLYVSEA